MNVLPASAAVDETNDAQLEGTGETLYVPNFPVSMNLMCFREIILVHGVPLRERSESTEGQGIKLLQKIKNLQILFTK